MTKIAKFKDKDTNELKNLLLEKSKELREARFGVVSGQLTNVRKIRILRKDIARLKTILNKPKEQSKNQKT